MPWFTKQKKKKARNTKKKKKTQKKQQIFRIKLRKDRFKMFGPYSKLISAIPAWFKAYFGRRLNDPIRPIRPDSGQISLVRHESVRIEAKLARICEKKKKKKAQTRHRWVGSCIGHCTPRRAALDSSVAPSQPHPCFIAFSIP